MSLNMESLFNPQSTYGIMDEKQVMGQDFDDHNHHVSYSWSSSSSINGLEEEDDDGDDEEEEVESCVSSSCSSPPTSPTSLSTPLQDMSSLLLQLPIKRGLSRHYNGKSQSFTSLSNVGCLEDLAKKENPLNKKLKTCKSYGGLSRNHTCSRLIAKKSSNNHNHRNHHHHNNRPPIPPPHRSISTSSFTHQTRLVV
ncbi:hypothetical protein CDL12_11298 [Handroanthus impetiginosus]|uniref:Uncharacterized protein n=1 Tax=Handroanthus impetiginosus TaxID=429701 RepID=A0A2G9HEV2_9LAMI|nr:hypothetical protein CDL12_11298 [Handroanthus impetiginosus]